MKKNLLSFLNVMMICVMTFFASCSKDNDVEDTTPTPNPDPVVTQPATYTVMLYGCGGGDLDKALKYNLGQIEGMGKISRVNFTGLVKYSKSFQANAETEGTRLLTLTDDGMKNERKYDINYRLDNPEHLANFIKESKEKMPADKYILVFWNHGGTFGPDDKPVQDSYPEETAASRAVLFDDSTKYCMSTYEIEKGIKDSGTKLDLIYFDVCLMGMAEPYYQLKDCAKYIMGAAHTTPELGGNYARLFSELQENDSLTDAIKAYVPAAVTDWKNTETGAADLECYDMQYMDEFAMNMKTATDAVLTLKKSLTEIPDGLSDRDKQSEAKIEWFRKTQYDENKGGLVYPFEQQLPSVDICSLLTRLAAFYADGKLSSAATLVRRTLEKMTVATSSFKVPTWLDRVSLGINWPTDVFLRQKTDKYEQALRSSAFCQATGWDKILFDTQNPKISYVKSAYNYANFYYLGDLSTITYSWDAIASADESQVNDKNRGAVLDKFEDINDMSAKALASLPYPLRSAPDIAYDLYFAIFDKYKEDLEGLGVTKIKIHVQLKDGQTVNPKDPDGSKYATSVDKEYDLANPL